MKQRIAALGAIVFLLGAVPYFSASRYHSKEIRTAKDSSLIPSVVGDFRAGERWTYPPRTLSGIEKGAMYAANGNPQKVQFDMFLGALNAHNGIECYIARGSRIVWQSAGNIAAHDGPATFGLALMEDDAPAGKVLKLVAATECSSQVCAEKSLITAGFEFTKPGALRLLGFSPRAVPLSVTLQAATGIAENQLVAVLRSFVSSLDLSPYRAYSAVQSR